MLSACLQVKSLYAQKRFEPMTSIKHNLKRTCSQTSMPMIGIWAGTKKSEHINHCQKKQRTQHTQYWILVRSSHNFEFLRKFMISLTTYISFSDWSYENKKRTSHPHPLPWIAALVVLKIFLNSSKEPKSRPKACSRGPEISWPPPELTGVKLVQNKEWLICPIHNRMNCGKVNT